MAEAAKGPLHLSYTFRSHFLCGRKDRCAKNVVFACSAPRRPTSCGPPPDTPYLPVGAFAEQLDF